MDVDVLSIAIVATVVLAVVIEAVREAVAAVHEKGEKRHRFMQRIVMWFLAALDNRWQGLSLTRLLAIGIAYGTFHLAHDWLDKAPPGWAFVAFVLTGFLVAVVTALGARHIDRLVEILGTAIVAKCGGTLPPKPGDDHARTPAPTRQPE